LSAAFLFAFFGFLRIGEITETGNASDNHVIKISDIKFSLSFFPNIAAVVAAPILKECVL
jgi:hypothetical protein